MLERIVLCCQLLVIGCFAIAGWHDLRTRRVPDRLWYCAGALGVVVVAITCVGVPPGSTDPSAITRRTFTTVLVSSLGYVYWRLGLFGGADAKAICVLSIAFGARPVELFRVLTVDPLVTRPFVLSVVLNALVLSLCYPLGLCLWNLAHGHVTPAMVVGRPCRTPSVLDRHGELLQVTAGRLPRTGADLDALRWYLDFWELEFRHLTSSPDDLGVHIDGDRWGARTMLNDVGGTLFGTTPTQLRRGLDQLTGESDTVWVTPGIPFVTVLLAGLVVTLLWGDLLAVASVARIDIVQTHQHNFQFRAVVRRFLFGDA